MKYSNLTQICDFLQKFKRIKHIKRVGDTLFKIDFDDEILFFDMNKTNSNIHKNENFTQSKIYKAPFDIILQKRVVKSEILEIFVPKNNRILVIKTIQNTSYKSYITYIYFEFTGRFTNVILTDENKIILEALRHHQSVHRLVQTGQKLIELEPTQIKEKNSEKIVDFDEFFKNEFTKINQKNLQEIKENKIIQIDKKLESLNSLYENLQSEDELLKNAKEQNEKAQILLANLYNLNEFDRVFTLLDFQGQKINFNLEDSPKNSANEYFLNAKKLKQKALNSHIQKNNLEDKIEFLQNLKTMILNSNSKDEIEILLPKKSGKKIIQTSDNIENFYVREFKISVGKNEKGNIELLKNSNKNDFWFHLKDIPSAHVIVKTNKQNIDDEIINLAGKICVNFSVKNSGNYLVDYTKRVNVKVKEKAFVNYINYKTITILKP